MATFRDENGKILTKEELQRMMESARPLTDEELEQVSGGSVILNWSGVPMTCSHCGGDDFEWGKTYPPENDLGVSLVQIRCMNCNQVTFVTCR